MALVRWSPFQELDTMDRVMRRMVDQLGVTPAWPAADVYASNGELVYELEVPGYDEKDLTIEVRDHTLTVKGEKTERKEEKEKTFYLNERLARTFERRFELPPTVIADKVAAEFKQGVLVVHAPRAAEAEARTIAISAKK
jgi:HSP20 family protein